MTKFILSLVLAFTFVIPHTLHASNEAPKTFTQEQCDSLSYLKFIEKVYGTSNVIIIGIGVAVRHYAGHLPYVTLASLIPVLSGVLGLCNLAYGILTTPDRAERTAYCAKMERIKANVTSSRE